MADFGIKYKHLFRINGWKFGRLRGVCGELHGLFWFIVAIRNGASVIVTANCVESRFAFVWSYCEGVGVSIERVVT